MRLASVGFLLLFQCLFYFSIRSVNNHCNFFDWKSQLLIKIWFVQFSFQHPCHTVNVHTFFDLTLLQVLPFHTLAVPFWIPQGFHRFPVMSCHFLPSLSSLKLHIMCSQRLYLEEPDIFPFFPLRECFFREFYAPAWLTRMPKNLLHSLFKIRIILAK